MYDPVNKKVIGKMKDEFGGVPISESVCIRPKMYSILTVDANLKKAKGVTKVVINKNLKHDMYRDCIFNNKNRSDKMTMIRSTNHALSTIDQTKLSLSPLDTKRYVLPDGIKTLAYGHYKISSGNSVSGGTT